MTIDELYQHALIYASDKRWLSIKLEDNMVVFIGPEFPTEFCSGAGTQYTAMSCARLSASFLLFLDKIRDQYPEQEFYQCKRNGNWIWTIQGTDLIARGITLDRNTRFR